MGLFDSAGEFLFGKKDTVSQLPTMNQNQMGALNQVLSQLQSMGASGGNYGQAQNYYGSLLGGDKSVYDRFAAPYLQQFEQETIPRLAERFAGLGGGLGGGSLGSSGFAQAIGGAGAGLQAQLASLFANLQRDAARDVTGQYNTLLGQGLGSRPFENVYQPGNTGVLGGAITGLAGGAGTGIGMGTGFGLTNLLTQYFNKGK